MAKRIASPSAKWSYIVETFSPVERKKVLPLKTLSDKYARQISEKPADLPKIDWAYYKARISAPGVVDAFQKGYEGLKIPYPSDQGVLGETESENTKMMNHAEKIYKELVENIEELKVKLKEREAVMKYSEMFLEEYFLANPEMRFDPDNPKEFLEDAEDAEDEAGTKVESH